MAKPYKSHTIKKGESERIERYKREQPPSEPDFSNFLGGFFSKLSENRTNRTL